MWAAMGYQLWPCTCAACMLGSSHGTAAVAMHLGSLHVSAYAPQHTFPPPPPTTSQGLTPLMAFHATWDACKEGTITSSPDFFTTNPQPKDHTWWVGLREYMEPLVDKCHILGISPYMSISWASYRNGAGIPAHPRHAYLHTSCVVPPGGTGFLDDLPKFKLQPHGSCQQGCSRGYFKVPKDERGNDKEFYLHDILCYMYNGPPPDPSLVVGHLCGNKLCILGWHLYWITQADNVVMGLNKKRKKWAL